MIVTVRTMQSDGSWTEEKHDLGPELDESLAQARAEWDRLREVGTPYWCIHEGREVDHRRAFWQDDQTADEDPVHRKHGVMCRDCGGYIQEG